MSIEATSKEKIVHGLSDALGFAKGADNGERITIFSATEFYVAGVRFNPGSYEIRKRGLGQDAPGF